MVICQCLKNLILKFTVDTLTRSTQILTVKKNHFCFFKLVSIIMGDFNLDENHKNNTQYSHHRYYDLLNDRFIDLNMIQLVNFNTWSRLVGNTLKESRLDHF